MKTKLGARRFQAYWYTGEPIGMPASSESEALRNAGKEGFRNIKHISVREYRWNGETWQGVEQPLNSMI